MIGHRALSAHYYAIAKLRRPSKRRVRADEALPADEDVVADLHEVVHLRLVANHRVAPAAAIDACIGSELDAIAEQHAQKLRLLVDAAVLVIREAKAVGANAHAAVQNAVCANITILD